MKKYFCKTENKSNKYIHRLSVTYDLVKIVDISKHFSNAISQVVVQCFPSLGFRIPTESDWLTSILGILMRSDVTPLALYPVFQKRCWKISLYLPFPNMKIWSKNVSSEQFRKNIFISVFTIFVGEIILSFFCFSHLFSQDVILDLFACLHWQVFWVIEIQLNSKPFYYYLKWLYCCLALFLSRRNNKKSKINQN